MVPIIPVGYSQPTVDGSMVQSLHDSLVSSYAVWAPEIPGVVRALKSSSDFKGTYKIQ